MVMVMIMMVRVHITEPHHSKPGVQAARAFNLAINIPLPSNASLLSLHMHHIQQLRGDLIMTIIGMLERKQYVVLLRC
jgi:hypothetical protein